MSEAFFEKIDVLLPGQGDQLAQAPAHHWQRAERANAQIYYSTREPKSVLIHLTGLAREERKALADMPIEVDLSALKYHGLRRVWCPSTGTHCHDTGNGYRRLSKTTRFDGGRRQPS